ncbi:MAG TPA: NAD(P)H-dependent oxidoreductase [Polyangiaceae bacterium]|nr:NAD(P)H-dependent oxidoreductase [Polyangiaceae bacterium]
MTSVTPRIGVILASVREGRRGEGFARWILALLSERPDVEVELLDLRDYPIGAYTQTQMPPVVEKTYADETLRRWSEKIHGLDGFLIVTPEYSHGYPGHLKNAIDHVSTGWWYKPVSFVSYGGGASGARAVEQLRSVAIELRMVPTRGEVNIRLVGLELDEAGAPKDPFYGKQAKAMLDQLLWWTRAAKQARGAEPPPGF